MCVADLPGVGGNLQDHVQLPVIYRTNIKIPNTTLLPETCYLCRREKAPSARSAGFTAQFHAECTKTVAASIAGFRRSGMHLPPHSGATGQHGDCGLTLFESAGTSHRESATILRKDADYQVFVNALDLIREIANANAFAELNGGELAPGDGDPEGFIRSQASTLWHPAGTCKIGKDAMAVLDPYLRVYGIDNLRVADASVMPTVTSGNTVAACFMIGEKAADMILAG